MPRHLFTSVVEGSAAPLSRARSWLWLTRYFAMLWPILLILVSSNHSLRSAVVHPAYSHTVITSPSRSVDQNVQYQAALIRDNLPAYLNFVGSQVLPVMSRNVDELLHNLKGLTDIKPGLFYHGHIDYSVFMSGGVDDLMNMQNIVLQYHTLETPRIYISYWRTELGNIHDQKIDAWLARSNAYNQAISASSSAYGIQYTPLTNAEAVAFATSWDTYRRQHGLDSPKPAMLTNMLYLVDGSKQPLYQQAFKDIYKFHSIAFRAEGYVQLNNRTHLENTFSPFQVTFEYAGKCQELLPIFDEARTANFGYILNFNNLYTARYSDSLQNPQMASLSQRLNEAISALPDDNLIKLNSTPQDQQIAYFAVGNYIFAIYGSLDSPSIFR